MVLAPASPRFELYERPRADAAPVAVQQSARLLRLCQLQLLATVLLSRFAIPFGSKQIQFAWVIGIVFFVVIAFKTGFALNLVRVGGLFAIALVMLLELSYYHSSYSPLSLFYLFAIYGPLCLSLPSLNGDHMREIWKTMTQIATVLAVCGLLQVVVQLGTHYFLDPLTFLPKSFLLAGYTSFYPTSIGPLHYVKPTGMFALEPSFFSQFVALGLIAELQFFRRKNLIFLFIAALLVSFAGTGLMVLFVSLPFIKQSPKWIVMLLAAGLLWNVTIGSKTDGFYAQRLEEFNKPGQSGNARFIFPYQVMAEWWDRSPEYRNFGIGAGQSSTLNTVFEANFAPVAKVGLEFGLIGLIAFFLLWVGMFWDLALPACLKAALLMFYFVASGALLHPPTVFPIWTLTLGFMRSSQRLKKA